MLLLYDWYMFFFFSSRIRHTRCSRDWSSDVCSSDLSPELDERGAVRLEAYAHGVDAALGQIVAVAHGAMFDGSWSRLKACRNCRWVFHDYSRNRSASWCSMLLCGGRHKTRAYRRRLKARQA